MRTLSNSFDIKIFNSNFKLNLKRIMKKRNLLLVGALLCAINLTNISAQNNLGQDCGCPAVSDRSTIVNLSTLTNGGAGVNAPELAADAHLTCDKIWVLDEKIYVPNGLTLTIDPGTVIKGLPQADPSLATCLVIERGGKIMADGTQSCPIVFTANEDPMDDSYSLTNVGKWGGVVILGKASNSLILAKNNVTLGAGHICVGYDGVGYIEGFDASNGLNLFGAGDPSFPTADDNDNSGIFRYVSVRHAGAILQIGNELNGISLGSVGRGTTFEHVEVIAAADDNIEYFGGTVNVKYISTLFGDDDQFDWDLGYSGKAQFYFGISSDSLNIGNKHTTDNGFEMDADDNKAATATSNHSHPVCYNITMVSNGHIIPSADNTGPAAIQAKELTGGEIYNSIFANWRSGLHLAMARSNATDKGDAYDQWTNDGTDPYLIANGGIAQAQTLLIKNNVFVNCGSKSSYGNTMRYPLTKGALVSGKNPALYKAFTVPSPADTTQFFQTDGNIAIDALPGFDWTIAFSPDNSVMTDPFHVIPAVNLMSTMTAPNDGFFTPVSFKGAFDANKKANWLSDWAIVQMQTLQNSNPTDLNGDGVTDILDFGIFVGRFGYTDL
jgi:hypothetical protein